MWVVCFTIVTVFVQWISFSVCLKLFVSCRQIVVVRFFPDIHSVCMPRAPFWYARGKLHSFGVERSPITYLRDQSTSEMCPVIFFFYFFPPLSLIFLFCFFNIHHLTLSPSAASECFAFKDGLWITNLWMDLREGLPLIGASLAIVMTKMME